MNDNNDGISQLSADARRLLDRRRLECFSTNQTNVMNVSSVDNQMFCNATFDGWSCWPLTYAGNDAFVPCPDFITGFDPKRFAFKTCTMNGSWFKHPISGKTWSNYTTCIDYDDLRKWCWMLHIVLYYFLLTNYMWMLCEGIYLHTILVKTFISECKVLKSLIVLGWLAPCLCMIPYVAFRHADPQYTNECWINESPYKIFLLVPVCITLGFNFLFLCNIIRVILIKSRYREQLGVVQSSNNTLPALRATLILVPLLGIQYFLTPIRPPKGHYLEVAYEYLIAFTASFQGLFVSILFCFCNHEVCALFFVLFGVFSLVTDNPLIQYTKYSAIFSGIFLFINASFNIFAHSKPKPGYVSEIAYATTLTFIVFSILDVFMTSIQYDNTMLIDKPSLTFVILLKVSNILLSVMHFINLKYLRQLLSNFNDNDEPVTLRSFKINEQYV